MRPPWWQAATAVLFACALLVCCLVIAGILEIVRKCFNLTQMLVLHDAERALRADHGNQSASLDEFTDLRFRHITRVSDEAPLILVFLLVQVAGHMCAARASEAGC